MSLKTYKRIALGRKSFGNRHWSFLSGGDKFSVISLAGADDVISARLVLNIGEENFTEFPYESKCQMKFKWYKENLMAKKSMTLYFINDLSTWTRARMDTSI